MTNPYSKLAREKPVRTLLRGNEVHKELQTVRCEVCKKILYQDFVGVHDIVPGHPDTEIDPALLDDNTIILECRNMIELHDERGKHINTRCGTRYFVT